MDAALIHRWALEQEEEDYSPGTLTVALSVLSGLYRKLQRDRLVAHNPCLALPAETRALLRSRRDPTKTPFIEKLDDVRRIFLSLDPPLHVAYARGALGGLRPCEIFSLEWPSVDLERRRIFIRKEFGKERTVPILDSLLPVLKEWKLKSGGVGVVCPPLRRDGKKIDKRTRGERLQQVLTKLGLARPGLGWYEATRHTFASQWARRPVHREAFEDPRPLLHRPDRGLRPPAAGPLQCRGPGRSPRPASKWSRFSPRRA